MKIKEQEVTLSGVKGSVKIKRQELGVPKITADNEIDLYYGIGYMHGHDRQVQLWLTNLIGWGRASENLEGSEELIAIDKYMRWIDMAGDAGEEVKRFSPETREITDAYCRGVNDAVSQTRRPFEFKMVGFEPDQWTPEDIVLMVKMLGFIGLTQSQGAVEKFIIEALQHGVPLDKLKELFTYLTDTPSEEHLDIIRKVKVDTPNIPPDVHWLSSLPSFHASNNWAVSPKKTKSEGAMLCGDPHLESNRLPSILYEAIMVSGDTLMMGATLPGAPFLGIGRCKDIAWSATYSFMDVVDYFIEDVKGKKYRRGDRYIDFEVREEVIKPKKGDPITLKFYENDLGVLEGEPEEDGFYLNFAWSARKGGAAESINSLIRVPKSKDAKEAMKNFSAIPTVAFNWVMADTSGNIGYQMSGKFPEKAPGTSGLLPYLAWDESQHWRGFIDPKKYPQQFNPKEGFIATANEDANHLGKVKPQNMPMGSYRRDRIANLLDAGKDFSIDDMKKMHYDTYSLQAELFMEIIRPLLPDNENGNILRNWDLRYETDREGATLFERVYEELMKIVFGENGFGTEVVGYTLTELSIFNDFFGFFDEVLFKEESIWFGEKTREKIYKEAIGRGLEGKAVPYGKVHNIMMTNLFFGGKLPGFLGFDYGPVELIGSRATIPQGQIFKEAGRLTTFMPCLRIICDLSEEVAHTNLPGGPSDRRFSKYYKSNINDYLTGKYKALKP